MDSAYNRFSTLLEEKHLKPSDITRLSGVSSTVLTEWKKGKSTPKTDKLISIARALQTTVEYLITGSEPGQPANDEHRARDSAELELLRKWRKLDNYGQMMVKTVLETAFLQVTNGKEVKYGNG